MAKGLAPLCNYPFVPILTPYGEWMNTINSYLSLSCHLPFSLSLSLPLRWTPLGGGWSHSRHHPPPRNANHQSRHQIVHHHTIIANPNPKTYNTFWRPQRRIPLSRQSRRRMRNDNKCAWEREIETTMCEKKQRHDEYSQQKCARVQEMTTISTTM